MTRQDELIAYLFEGKTNLLGPVLSAWLDALPRFERFLQTYKDKVRKKIRIARDTEALLDLHAELLTARVLLEERQFSVAYEPFASQKIRGPDFTVTYRTHLNFNLEVTRMRQPDPGQPASERGESTQAVGSRDGQRILKMVLDKLGQMQPMMINLLLVHVQDLAPGTIELEPVMHALKRQAETKDAPFYTRGEYASPAEFFKYYQRLSGILVWYLNSDLTTLSPQIWINKQAKHPLPEKVTLLLRRAGSGLSPG